MYEGFAEKAGTIERTERDKDPSEQQLNKNQKSSVTGKRNWKLSNKICADLNRNRFLFQCKVHNNASNKLKKKRKQTVMSAIY